MKKRKFAVAAALMTLMIGGVALATDANVQVFTDHVTATASNSTGYMMVCSGRVAGVTYSGQTYYAWMNNVAVPPGQYRYVFVRTNPNLDPFVNGWSDIACVFP